MVVLTQTDAAGALEMASRINASTATTAVAAGTVEVPTPHRFQVCVAALTATVLRLDAMGKLRRVTSVLKK